LPPQPRDTAVVGHVLLFLVVLGLLGLAAPRVGVGHELGVSDLDLFAFASLALALVLLHLGRGLEMAAAEGDEQPEQNVVSLHLPPPSFFSRDCCSCSSLSASALTLASSALMPAIFAFCSSSLALASACAILPPMSETVASSSSSVRASASRSLRFFIKVSALERRASALPSSLVAACRVSATSCSLSCTVNFWSRASPSSPSAAPAGRGGPASLQRAR